METSAVQRKNLSAIVDEVGTVTIMVMVEATKEGGMHVAPSTRAIGASVKYIGRSKEVYKDNPIVKGVIDQISQWRGETNRKFDYKTLDSNEVIRNVDAIVPDLELEGENGTQTKQFILGLAEAMVGASGSGFMGTGERVNEGEARFIDELKTHLRL